MMVILIPFLLLHCNKGPFKCYVCSRGWEGVRFPGKKRYEDEQINVISVTRGWVGIEFPEKSVM